MEDEQKVRVQATGVTSLSAMGGGDGVTAGLESLKLEKQRGAVAVVKESWEIEVEQGLLAEGGWKHLCLATWKPPRKPRWSPGSRRVVQRQ